MKKHNIRPGTDEWFKLWFSKPYLTGEKPVWTQTIIQYTQKTMAMTLQKILTALYES
jgi:hypothetical protein